MKFQTKLNFNLLLCCILFFACNNSNTTTETKTETPKADTEKSITYASPTNGVSIFNGKDLTGWEIYGTEKWFVENGNLVCASGPDKQYGYLATDKQFKDFDLSLEFKQEADGNSGVFFRCSIEGTKITGWQSEVAPPEKHTGGIYESYGRGWLIKPDPALDKALKMGEWNTMRIRVKGDHVITWVNGTEMVNFKDEKIGAAMGKIALQIHDGGGIKVNWRNINIAEI